MKLLALKITSEFRNLEGLNLRFDSTNDTYVIIGNNGTGKTNILEALSSVFSTLLSHSTDFIFSFVFGSRCSFIMLYPICNIVDLVT